MMKDADVQAIAAKIFAAKLGPLGFDHVEVASGIDQDGDRSLFLDAFFRSGTQITAVRALVDAQVELHDSLISEGEERLPYVSFRLPGSDEPLPDDVEEFGRLAGS
jgi:hypothetical protein